MKVVVNIARVIIGVLFIFSGLVKAIDPRGLSYKMEEFFEAWAAPGNTKVAAGTAVAGDSVYVYRKAGETKTFEGGSKPDSSWLLVSQQLKPVPKSFFTRAMDKLHGHALLFSILMITLEVIAGLALLLGWRSKFFSWLLLLLILFFTFLTSYVLFTDKIRACGCFGDCIPLTPVQTFTKDIILLILALLMVARRKYIKPLFSGRWNALILLLATTGILLLQWYVLTHLPLIDCLPYKKGNHILKLREMPADAVPDKFTYSFVYEKNGEQKTFSDMKNLPDSTWTFKERKQILLAKGKNNTPLINDFSLSTASGEDTTTALLSTPGEYFMVFVRAPEQKSLGEGFEGFYKAAGSRPVFFITSERDKLVALLGGKPYGVFTCDATALKTAARNEVTIYKMKGPVVQGKWSGRDIEDVR